MTKEKSEYVEISMTLDKALILVLGIGLIFTFIFFHKFFIDIFTMIFEVIYIEIVNSINSVIIYWNINLKSIIFGSIMFGIILGIFFSGIPLTIIDEKLKQLKKTKLRVILFIIGCIGCIFLLYLIYLLNEVFTK